MAIAIISFGDEFRKIAFGHMAIHAHARGMVAALVPRIVIIIHHMAIGAGLRIVAKVRESLSVGECVKPQPGTCAAQQAENRKETWTGNLHLEIITSKNKDLLFEFKQETSHCSVRQKWPTTRQHKCWADWE